MLLHRLGGVPNKHAAMLVHSALLLLKNIRIIIIFWWEKVKKKSKDNLRLPGVFIIMNGNRLRTGWGEMEWNQEDMYEKSYGNR